MAWLEGTAERELEVSAPLDEVAEFFADPGRFEHCIDDLEHLEEVEEDVWQFQLEELSAKGVSFQGEYVVEYARDGELVTWEPAGEGNMRSEGRVRLDAVGEGRTRVRYEQTMSVELPIPKLMTKVFRPIVNREVRKAIESMLDCAKEALDAEDFEE